MRNNNIHTINEGAYSILGLNLPVVENNVTLVTFGNSVVYIDQEKNPYFVDWPYFIRLSLQHDTPQYL